MNKGIRVFSQCILLFCYWVAAMALFLDNKAYIQGWNCFEYRSSISLCILYVVVVVLCLYLFEAFNIKERRILDLIYGHIFGSLCSNVFFTILFCVITAMPFRLILELFLVLLAVEAVLGSLWAAMCFYMFLKSVSVRKALFVYGNREDSEVYIRDNNKINNYFTIDEKIFFGEGLTTIFKKIEGKAAVFIGDIPFDERNRILKFCLKHSIECYAIPKMSDIYIQNTDVLQMHDKMLFKYRQNGLTNEKRNIKRASDLVIACLMLVLASPIMLIIAILIKVEDGGEILYRQKRVTEGGREFEIYKFRSMHSDAETSGAQLAKKNDTRVTKVGKVIRNIHFDEFPQLVNIIKGDMSLVGPRPERREFIDAYVNVIPEFTERLKVKAGLTGYAQIYGKYNSVPEDKIKYDLMYIYSYSLRLDIKLILLTIRILFQKENTEGVDAEQISAIKVSGESKKDE